MATTYTWSATVAAAWGNGDNWTVSGDATTAMYPGDVGYVAGNVVITGVPPNTNPAIGISVLSYDSSGITDNGTVNANITIAAGGSLILGNPTVANKGITWGGHANLAATCSLWGTSSATSTLGGIVDIHNSASITQACDCSSVTLINAYNTSSVATGGFGILQLYDTAIATSTALVNTLRCFGTNLMSDTTVIGKIEVHGTLTCGNTTYNTTTNPPKLMRRGARFVNGMTGIYVDGTSIYPKEREA